MIIPGGCRVRGKMIQGIQHIVWALFIIVLIWLTTVAGFSTAYISLDKAIAGNAVAVYFAPKDKTSEVGLLKLSSKDAQPVLITLICRSDYELGDVNKDDVVDISDVVMTVNYVLGNETNESVLVYGDLDGNGIIDITDVVALVNQILQVSNE